MSVELHNSNLQVVETSSATFIVFNFSDTSATYSLSDVCDINFTKVEKIGDRYIDVNIHINSVELGSFADVTSNNSVALCKATTDSFYFGDDNSSGYGYGATKNIDQTVTITWSDTGEIVDLPFFQVASDIDAWWTYFNEAWEAKDGFTGTFYEYPTSDTPHA